jgi:hypothetical protein
LSLPSASAWSGTLEGFKCSKLNRATSLGSCCIHTVLHSTMGLPSKEIGWSLLLRNLIGCNHWEHAQRQDFVTHNCSLEQSKASRRLHCWEQHNQRLTHIPACHRDSRHHWIYDTIHQMWGATDVQQYSLLLKVHLIKY